MQSESSQKLLSETVARISAIEGQLTEILNIVRSINDTGAHKTDVDPIIGLLRESTMRKAAGVARTVKGAVAPKPPSTVSAYFSRKYLDDSNFREKYASFVDEARRTAEYAKCKDETRLNKEAALIWKSISKLADKELANEIKREFDIMRDDLKKKAGIDDTANVHSADEVDPDESIKALATRVPPKTAATREKKPKVVDIDSDVDVDTAAKTKKKPVAAAAAKPAKRAPTRGRAVPEVMPDDDL